MKKLSYILFITLLSTVVISCDNNDDTDMSSVANCDNVCDYTLTSGQNAATVPSGLDGTYNMIYDYAQTGSPFANGTTATFILSNNTLTVEIEGEDCITLNNPVLIGTDNYKFMDNCVNSIGYNVSANTDGSLNEINVEPLGVGWYGQFYN